MKLRAAIAVFVLAFFGDCVGLTVPVAESPRAEAELGSNTRFEGSSLVQ